MYFHELNWIWISFLDNNSKSFLCFKCHHISVAASRYHGYEVETSKRFSVLNSLDESVFGSPGAPPKHRSSPIGTTKSTRPASIHLSAMSSTQSRSSASSATASNCSTAMTRTNSTPPVNTLPHKNTNNWHTLIINANSIAGKGASLEHILT